MCKLLPKNSVNSCKSKIQIYTQFLVFECIMTIFYIFSLNCCKFFKNCHPDILHHRTLVNKGFYDFMGKECANFF